MQKLLLPLTSTPFLASDPHIISSLSPKFDIYLSVSIICSTNRRNPNFFVTLRELGTAGKTIIPFQRIRFSINFCANSYLLATYKSFSSQLFVTHISSISKLTKENCFDQTEIQYSKYRIRAKKITLACIYRQLDNLFELTYFLVLLLV